MINMDLARPFAALTPTLDGDVLRVLANTSRPMTAPTVAALAGNGSEAGIRKALQRLAGQGLVTRERTGHHDSYLLNRGHLPADAVLAIAAARLTLQDRITATVTHWRIQPIFLALFGSVLTPEMRPDSDVDIAIIRPDDVPVDDPNWVDQCIHLAERGQEWTGNDVRFFELSATEASNAAEHGERVVADIRERGLALVGEFPR